MSDIHWFTRALRSSWYVPAVDARLLAIGASLRLQDLQWVEVSPKISTAAVRCTDTGILRIWNLMDYGNYAAAYYPPGIQYASHHWPALDPVELQCIIFEKGGEHGYPFDPQ
jgi:hypothetical protein